MFERFTDRARDVMMGANREAQRLHHDYIGTEHVLLGLVQPKGGTAVAVLKNLNLDPKDIQREVESLITPGPVEAKKSRGFFSWLQPSDKLPQTPRAKKVVEYAMEEARELRHHYVGTEHILLGLLRVNDGVAASVLTKFALNVDDVRRDVARLVATTGRGL